MDGDTNRSVFDINMMGFSYKLDIRLTSLRVLAIKMESYHAFLTVCMSGKETEN